MNGWQPIAVQADVHTQVRELATLAKTSMGNIVRAALAVYREQHEGPAGENVEALT